MAFQIVKASALPAHSRGRRRSSTPKIAITPSGRMVANTWLSAQWKDIENVILRWDDERRKVAVQGLKDGEVLPKGLKSTDILPVSRDKKNGVVSIAAASFLETLTSYDYAKAGHQSFAAVGHDTFGFVIELPAETPTQESDDVHEQYRDKPLTNTARR